MRHHTYCTAILVAVLGFALIGVCHGKDNDPKPTHTGNASTKDTISNVDGAGKDTSGGPETDDEPRSLIPIGALHEMIREERIATLLEIDKERKATLTYLTQERRETIDALKDMIRAERIATLLEIDKERMATLTYLTQERRDVIDALKAELLIIRELLMSERQATMKEIEAMGNQMIEKSLISGERLVDHFFVRLLQIGALLLLALTILGIAIYRLHTLKKP